MPKYAIDTNVYVDAIRSLAAASGLRRFLLENLPRTYLSAIVVQELRAGARTEAQVRALEEGWFAPFEQRGRVFSPTAAAFKDSGRLLAVLADRSRSHDSLANDALLAASCLESGMTLVSRDTDFRRIAIHLRGFRYLPPWP